MGRLIVKVDDWYFEWSTSSDAPVTKGMRRAEFETYYSEEYGREGMREFPARMVRVDQKGTSSYEDDCAEDTMRFNCAGYRGAELSPNEIVQIYCVEQRGPRKGEGGERTHDGDE